MTSALSIPVIFFIMMRSICNTEYGYQNYQPGSTGLGLHCFNMTRIGNYLNLYYNTVTNRSRYYNAVAYMNLPYNAATNRNQFYYTVANKNLYYDTVQSYHAAANRNWSYNAVIHTDQFHNAVTNRDTICHTVL